MVENLASQLKDEMTDEQFEALISNMPKRSREEAEAEVEDFLNHPLHVKEVTPEMMQRPEFQALQAMAYEGSPNVVAKNFLTHGLE